MEVPEWGDDGEVVDGSHIASHSALFADSGEKQIDFSEAVDKTAPSKKRKKKVKKARVVDVALAEPDAAASASFEVAQREDPPKKKIRAASSASATLKEILLKEKEPSVPAKITIPTSTEAKPVVHLKKKVSVTSGLEDLSLRSSPASVLPGPKKGKVAPESAKMPTQKPPTVVFASTQVQAPQAQAQPKGGKMSATERLQGARFRMLNEKVIIFLFP